MGGCLCVMLKLQSSSPDAFMTLVDINTFKDQKASITWIHHVSRSIVLFETLFLFIELLRTIVYAPDQSVSDPHGRVTL